MYSAIDLERSPLRDDVSQPAYLRRAPGQSIGWVRPTRQAPSASPGRTAVTGSPVAAPTCPTRHSSPQRTENCRLSAALPTVEASAVTCIADRSNPAAASASMYARPRALSADP